MNKNKLLIISVLVIFCLGISLSAVNATHIVKAGKYKAKLTDKQYNYLKKVEEVHNEGYNNDVWVNVKTGKYYTYKKPIYKNKKVKKRKYVYKYKLYYKSTWDPVDYSWHDSNSYNPKTPKGYKYVGSTYKTGNGWSKAYYKYRSIKKHSCWTTKKVKSGKYKKYKDPIYIYLGVSNGNGQDGKGIHITVWSSKYWRDYEKDILYIHKNRLSQAVT